MLVAGKVGAWVKYKKSMKLDRIRRIGDAQQSFVLIDLCPPGTRSFYFVFCIYVIDLP
jgi:hypothetical protein